MFEDTLRRETNATKHFRLTASKRDEVKWSKMLGADLRASLKTINGGSGEHGKRNSHVSHVSLVSNMKEEEAMMGEGRVKERKFTWLFR